MLLVNQSTELHLDATGFYRGQKPFYPYLEPGISLWEMGFELTLKPDLFEEFVEKILSFNQTLLPKVKNDILGVLLYKGAFNFSEPLKAEEEESYQDFCLEHPQTAYRLELFRGRMLADYIHRLISFFPEDLPIFLFCDVADLRPSLAAKLFNTQRFRYVHLGLKNSSIPLGIVTWENGYPTYGSTGNLKPQKRIPPSLGVCLPMDEFCTKETLDKLDALFTSLNQKGRDYRIIPEELLAEEWNGINKLLVLESALNPQGKRLLSGFQVTGGLVEFFDRGHETFLQS